jgi:hypothetical protein
MNPLPTALHASTAASMDPGRVKRNLVPAVFNACDISSTLYAGEAPLTQPPARMMAHIATGYHIVFVENRDTVSPGLRPYSCVRAELSRVALSLTSYYATDTRISRYSSHRLSFLLVNTDIVEPFFRYSINISPQLAFWLVVDGRVL